jgi:dTDP-4-dehydrorhamnose 3,5-epimerase
VELSAENKRMMWVPEGFAHGFLVLSETAEFLYKTTDYWRQEFERTIAWDDAELAIKWPDNVVPVLSVKDLDGLSLAQAELFS